MLNDLIKNALKTKKIIIFLCCNFDGVFFTLNKIVKQGISQQIHFDAWCCIILIHILLWKILLHDFI